MTDKRKMFNRYIETLKREGIEFYSYSDNYTINIPVGSRTITAYASKNWWRDPKWNKTGNGAIELAKHVLTQNQDFENTESKAKLLALDFIQKEYNQRSFIGKLLTRKSYNKAMKELQQ